MTTTEMQEQQPDALTRLERHAASASRDRPPSGFGGSERAFEERWYREAMDLISEARKEMEALREKCSIATRAAQMMSGKSSEALRMGQQQGRVELAQELLESWPYMPADIRSYLEPLVTEDANQ
jgi:hypothetical protein